MTTGAFHADFSLAALETQINAFTILWGNVTSIANDGTDSIAVYDDQAPGAPISLRPGPATPGAPGKPPISTGTVFIQGQQQTVTAYAA